MAAKKAPATPKKTAVKKKPGRPSLAERAADMADRAADMALKNIELEKLLAEVQDELSECREELRVAKAEVERCREGREVMSRNWMRKLRETAESKLLDKTLRWSHFLTVIDKHWATGEQEVLAQIRFDASESTLCDEEEEKGFLEALDRLKDALSQLYYYHDPYGDIECEVQQKFDIYNH